jgi:hypothetical protein
MTDSEDEYNPSAIINRVKDSIIASSPSTLAGQILSEWTRPFMASGRNGRKIKQIPGQRSIFRDTHQHGVSFFFGKRLERRVEYLGCRPNFAHLFILTSNALAGNSLRQVVGREASDPFYHVFDVGFGLSISKRCPRPFDPPFRADTMER